MRFGMITPVLTLSRIHNAWEEDASIHDAVDIVTRADRLGFHHVTCAEHVAVPVGIATERGGRYWDPVATLSYFAALTERIRLVTHTIVIGYHHPLAILKTYGSLDRLSSGRLILGVGVGSLQEEFAVLGAPFNDRGRRADDALRALRGGFGDRIPTHDGPYFAFSDFVVEPTSVQRPVPMWIGGRTWRSLQRALTLGDGWAPFRLTEEETGALLRRAAESEEAHTRDRPLDIVLVPEPALDPLGNSEHVLDTMGRHRDLGATVLNLYLQHDSRAHCLEQMEAFVAVTGAQMDGGSLAI